MLARGAEYGMASMIGLLVLHVLCLVVSYSGGVQAGKPINVSYDHRALIIDGQRRMLISAGIHYPRATPEMWPELIANAKEWGADVIQTYVFWSGHEPQQGMYNFAGRYDLPKFVKLVEEAGLYLNLRIGPYACAEWNFGGFPVWLRDVPGIVFRTDNQPFKDAMEGFVKMIVNLMKERHFFAWQGGPIILAQIENEYGDVEGEFGAGGRRYVEWAASMALRLEAGVPWIMCQQADAPSSIINTCNGYYCDGFKPNSPDKPVFWTEDWNGWYQNWGHAMPHRPVEDNAFAVARFFQRGGSFHNYYMFFGGTNFGRTAGGPYITTSYDYDAPVDEYGLVRQPKWGHLKDLHAALKLCEPALTSVRGEPMYIVLGPHQEGHVYAGDGQCAAFLANIDERSSATVQFKGEHYELPPWSVSILPDCKQVVFNTAQVGSQTTVRTMRRVVPKFFPAANLLSNMLDERNSGDTGQAELAWHSYLEPVGAQEGQGIAANFLLEQLNTTKDSTDYFWYTTSVLVSQGDVEILRNIGVQPRLVLEAVRDAVHVFVNGKLAGSATGQWIQVEQPVSIKAGSNDIALLSMTVGLQNYGAYLEKEGAGLQGSVTLQGLPSGNQDLTTVRWVHQVGLKGEDLKIFTQGGADSVTWDSPFALQQYTPLIWYKTKFDAPQGKEPVALDLGSMGKGQAWVNGKHLGRFWPSLHAPETGCSDTCDYRGTYYAEKCVTNCGQPSQRWYHLPRAWLKPKDNLLVLFEEMGGDPLQVSMVTVSQDAVCGHMSDSHPAPFHMRMHNATQYTVPSAGMRLECAKGYKILDIAFASFGNPEGKCGNFHQGTCHAVNSLAAVHEACMGKQQCTIAVAWSTFGAVDPCPTLPKSLAVQVHCSTMHHNKYEEPLAYPHHMWQRSNDGPTHLSRVKHPLGYLSM